MCKNVWINEVFVTFFTFFRCVIKDFEKRPFIEDLFKHPFIQKVPSDTSEVKFYFNTFFQRDKSCFLKFFNGGIFVIF